MNIYAKCKVLDIVLSAIMAVVIIVSTVYIIIEWPNAR